MLYSPSLQLTNYSVLAHDKQLVNNLSLAIGAGQLHVLMGPNGSGKSSLALSLMGHPAYQVTGNALLCAQDITQLPVHKRAQAGLFLSFQQPYELPGVPVASYLKAVYQAMHGHIDVTSLQKQIYTYLDLLELDRAFYERNVNEDFSGGQKKKFELLQLLLCRPKVAILDELDSGLDVDALRVVAQALQHARTQHPHMAVLLITHYQRILTHMSVDAVHLLVQGSLVRTGDQRLVQAIERDGYDKVAQWR